MWTRDGRTVAELVRDAHRRFTNAVFGPGIGVYNRVAVPDRGRLDSTLHHPNHKANLVEAVRKHVEAGDSVTVVGGGRSVVAVHALRQGGNVTVYEGAPDAARLSRDVSELNSASYEVIEAIVGEVDVGLRGDPDGVARVDPDDLAGDVLVLDCEGAEIDILPATGFETIIVETHPPFEAPTWEVRPLLESEYSVTDVRTDGLRGDVLTATKERGEGR